MAETMIQHAFAVGDKVVFTNDFGVCSGVRTVTGLSERTERPTYYTTPTETPWFSTGEENLVPADEEDLIMDLWGFDDAWAFFQRKYGFTPTEFYGCY